MRVCFVTHFFALDVEAKHQLPAPSTQLLPSYDPRFSYFHSLFSPLVWSSTLNLFHPLTTQVRNNLQLQLYSFAARHKLGQFPSHVSIESIEDGRCGRNAISPQEIQHGVNIALDAAHKIKNGRFDPTPSYQACSFCNFKAACVHSQAARWELWWMWECRGNKEVV